MLTRNKKIASISILMAKNALLPSAIPFRYTLNHQFKYSTGKWNRGEFTKKIDQQIIDLEGRILHCDPQNQAYFKKYQWEVKFIPEKVYFQFSKNEKEYDIKVLTYVKHTPPNSPENPLSFAFQKEDDQSKRLNYSQANVYIKKTGSEKWFVAQMAVFDGSVELLGLFFTNQQPSFNISKPAYLGPELSTLPKEVMKGINIIFNDFGITSQVLMNMVIHSSIKVEELDATWLKNLKEVWA